MKSITGSEVELRMHTPELAEHFRSPYNYTREIMMQFDMDYYQHFIPRNAEVILDIGANVGLFALHVSTLPRLKRLICVEPTPEHFSRLTELTSHLSFVERDPSALAGHTGAAHFHWCGINTTMNSLQPRGDRSFEVPALTLEDLLSKYKLKEVDFCKIDIEGSEDVAITIDTLRPVAERLRRVFIELHPPNLESQVRWQQIFEAVGYLVEKQFHDSLMCVMK